MLLNARRKGFNREENTTISKPFRLRPVVKFLAGKLGMFVFREKCHSPRSTLPHASHARAPPLTRANQHAGWATEYQRIGHAGGFLGHDPSGRDSDFSSAGGQRSCCHVTRYCGGTLPRESDRHSAGRSEVKKPQQRIESE